MDLKDSVIVPKKLSVHIYICIYIYASLKTHVSTAKILNDEL